MNNFIKNKRFYNFIIKDQTNIHALIKSSYDIKEETCFISQFYISNNLRKKNISDKFFCNHEQLILINHPNIKYFKLNAINFNNSYKLINFYNKLGYKENLDHMYEINYGEIIPMIKIIK